MEPEWYARLLRDSLILPLEKLSAPLVSSSMTVFVEVGSRRDQLIGKSDLDFPLPFSWFDQQPSFSNAVIVAC